jgi:hypothetical protein
MPVYPGQPASPPPGQTPYQRPGHWMPGHIPSLAAAAAAGQHKPSPAAHPAPQPADSATAQGVQQAAQDAEVAHLMP